MTRKPHPCRKPLLTAVTPKSVRSTPTPGRPFITAEAQAGRARNRPAGRLRWTESWTPSAARCGLILTLKELPWARSSRGSEKRGRERSPDGTGGEGRTTGQSQPVSTFPAGAPIQELRRASSGVPARPGEGCSTGGPAAEGPPHLGGPTPGTDLQPGPCIWRDPHT